MTRRLLLFLSSLFAFALACGGETSPEPAPGGALSLSSLPTRWVEVERAGDGWRLVDPCGISTAITIDGNHVESGGACAGVVSASAPSGSTLSVTLVDDNFGTPATLTFRWLDPAQGIGEWTWSGCILKPLPHVDQSRASSLPKAPGSCGGQ